MHVLEWADAAGWRPDSRLVSVMGCHGMSISDGLRYASEARICVGSERAYWAAAEGHPFLLPWRGPQV